MFGLFKKWFGKNEEAVVEDKGTKTGTTRLSPKPSTKKKSSKKYNPDQETIFPIDLNIKGMEALDCICLLAGFSFKNNKWIVPGANKETIPRTDVATVSDDVLDFINEHSQLVRVDYESETVGERIHEFGMAYQETILLHENVEVEIGDLKTHRDKTYITFTSDKPLIVSSERLCLLGPNMQIRYILEYVGIQDRVVTAKILGLHTRAPKSRKMYLVEL